MRVASPPIKYPCYMGINIPTKEELVANRVPMDKIANHFGKDFSYLINSKKLNRCTRNICTQNLVCLYAEDSFSGFKKLCLFVHKQILNTAFYLYNVQCSHFVCTFHGQVLLDDTNIDYLVMDDLRQVVT